MVSLTAQHHSAEPLRHTILYIGSESMSARNKQPWPADSSIQSAIFPFTRLPQGCDVFTDLIYGPGLVPDSAASEDLTRTINEAASVNLQLFGLRQSLNSTPRTDSSPGTRLSDVTIVRQHLPSIHLSMEVRSKVSQTC